MQYPTPHRRDSMRPGAQSDLLSATFLGLALMMIATVWWWYVMR